MELINGWDIAIARWVNTFAGHWPIFDAIVITVFRMNSVRILPLVAFLVWAWFADRGDGARRRHVFDGIVGYALSLVISQGMQPLMPPRPRPEVAGLFTYHHPVGDYANDFSSFPSDTAAQTFALVMAIWLISRPWGLAAAIWGVVVVCFPRLYGGLHYPSDLIAGMLIGLFSTWLVSRRPLGLNVAARAVDNFEVRYKPWFYAASFIILYQIMSHLQDVQRMVSLLKGGVKHLLGS